MLVNTNLRAEYRSITIHGHPLADKSGKVKTHRLVLYRKIGPGTHRCHWCNSKIEWTPGRLDFKESIVADHVDGDTHNNDPDNLVPSCSHCNLFRDKGSLIEPGELTITMKNGKRTRATMAPCFICEKPFLTRVNRIGQPYGKCCSIACKNELVSRTDFSGRVNWNKIPDSTPSISMNGQRYTAVERDCAECGTKFLSRSGDSKRNRGKLCSAACRARNNSTKGRVERRCEHCQSTFRVKRSSLKFHPHRFCSRSCASRSAYHKGTSLSKPRAA